MPELLEKERKAARRLAVQRLGLSADVQRSFMAQVEGADGVASIWQLPVSVGDFVLMQDSASGTPFFFPGLSPLGGSMPLAPKS